MIGNVFFFNTKYDISRTIINIELIEAGRGAAARGVTVKLAGCGFDPHSRR